VTLNPNASLAVNTRYTVRIANGIADATGNPLAATAWSFTTEAGPAISSRTPGTGATGVSRTGHVTVRFSEPVRGIGGSTVILTDSTGRRVSATVSYNASTRTATLNPGPTLRSNTRYTVRLTSGITDSTGNRLATSTWSFRTRR
jgi:hypothetical protein